MVESRNCVQREGVYRWFSSLTSAQRAEFLCGLLDLCVPIELRFIGSCLEDLARKDYHSLRDAEIKANNPADLSGLTNITDEVVRSKLLVSLALLGSDNREAAGVLYRTLTHIDSVINNYGLALNDGRTEEQFLLLFTMASNHPAFSFHQKQVLRQQLSQMQDILQASSSGGGDAPVAGPGSDRAAACHAPTQQQYSRETGSTSQAPLSTAPSSPADTYWPLSACQTNCTCWHKSQTKESGTASGATSGQGDQAMSQELPSPNPDLRPPLPPAHHLPSLPAGKAQDTAAPVKSHKGKAGKAVIERVVLRGMTHKSEDSSEFVFEGNWSDGFVSSVVRTQQEVAELMIQLSQVFPDEGLEKFLPPSLEVDPRCLTGLPCHVLQHHSVQLFFTSNRPLLPNCPSSPSSSIPHLPSSLPSTPVGPSCPFISSSSLGCMLQYRGANRAVYRVASVQPVVSTHNSVLTRSAPHLTSIPPPLPLPPPIASPMQSPQLCSLSPPMQALPTRTPTAGTGDTSSQAHHAQPHSYPQPDSQHHLHPHTSSQPSTQPQPLHLSHAQQAAHSHSHLRSQSHTQPSTPEQNGILDWLRRLRLHKYYPVFKQLTMEEFLALTEEDLNKYDLTQGAKKKLKTQLELQKSADREMKMEKRPCSGIARVTPSSHMGPSAHSTSTAGELRVEVDGQLHHHPAPTDSSSSGYSSSSCSPHCCDNTFDRTRDVHRRVAGPDAAGGVSVKDRSSLFILNSSCPTGSSRPTAQVLPVQTDPAPHLPPSCPSHLPFSLPQTPYHPQASYPQPLLSPASNPARILTSPRKPRPSLLCTDERTKPLGAGLPAGGAGFGSGVGVRLENLFTGLNIDSSSGVQDSVVCRGRGGAALGLMVETSSALTSTSNSLHHVSQPPLLFHLSSSASPSPSGCYSYPPTSSSSSSSSYSCTSSKPSPQSGNSGSAGGYVSMVTASSVPVATVPGNAYYPAQPTSSPSPSSSSASLDQSSGHSLSMCVCSSCGCLGNCGAYGALPGYAASGYLQPFSPGSPLFTLGPLVHLSPLIASSSAAGPGATPFSYPMMIPPPLYRHSLASHDQQQSFGFYQPHSIIGNGGQKRTAGNLSCYNCGGSGHRADDCKQPPTDSGQQGTFRLKFTPHSEGKDSVD